MTEDGRARSDSENEQLIASLYQSLLMTIVAAEWRGDGLRPITKVTYPFKALERKMEESDCPDVRYLCRRN